MRWHIWYLMGRELDAKIAMLAIGLLGLASISSISQAKYHTAVQAKCYRAFAAQGFSEHEVWGVSERQVLKVCGHIPRYRVNRIWHANRNRPVGVIEKSAELTKCHEALEAVGIVVEKAEDVPKERLIEVCGIVPALLD